jgi:hypothetical protein
VASLFPPGSETARASDARIPRPLETES